VTWLILNTTGSSLTAASETTNSMFWLGTVTGQYNTDTRRTNARLPEKILDLDHLEFWNESVLGVGNLVPKELCKHGESCDTLQVRRASRIR